MAKIPVSKKLAALMVKAKASKVGKVLDKVPGPVKKGYAAGMMVPFPGSATTGAAIGGLVHGKRLVEGAVRAKTGRAYRMFAAVDEREQVRQDRKTLLRGALVAAGSVAGGIYLLKKSKGGVVGQVHSAPAVAKAAKPLRKGEALKLNAARRGKTAEGAVGRTIKAADLRAGRAWGAMKPATTKGLVKLKPDDRKKYGELVSRAQTAKGRYPAGQVTSKEAFIGDRGARMKARQEVAAFRRKKNFESTHQDMKHFKEDRDKLSKTRDAAIIAGTGAVGTGALVGGLALRKTAKKADETLGYVKQQASRAGRQVSQRVTADKVAAAGLRQVKKKAKDTGKAVLKKNFPTFIKAARKIGFVTPASELFEFGGKEQWKEAGTNVYADPLKAAAGLQKVYYRKNAAGDPILESLPIAHAQTIRAGYRKAKQVNKVAKRGGSLARDVVETVAGKPRRKDAAGRTKKKEWEKSWFKDGVRNAAGTAALLGGAAYLRKNPRARAKVIRSGQKATKWVNSKLGDAIPRGFETPASALFEFDEVAKAAGWDVRDPRGKSARVFAPGSRKRVRREKEWHEKADNERKLWKAGVVAAALAAGAGGVAVGRKLKLKPKAAKEVIKPPSNVINPDWKKQG